MNTNNRYRKKMKKLNELQNFSFKGNNVRTVMVNAKPYFIGNDVAQTLGYTDYRHAVTNHVNEEDKLRVQIDHAGQSRLMTVISESGIYDLIFDASRQGKNANIREQAKKFRHWVTNDVLPSIRKHGTYMTPETIEKTITDPDFIINLATQLKTEREGRLMAEQQVKEYQPKVSYYDRVLANDALVTISVIAKDYGMSGGAMNKKLHELGVQYRQGTTWLLYAKYQTTGWTHSETRMVTRKDGTEKAVLNTKWTQRGRLGLYELLKSNGYLPLIEQDHQSQTA